MYTALLLVSVLALIAIALTSSRSTLIVYGDQHKQFSDENVAALRALLGKVRSIKCSRDLLADTNVLSNLKREVADHVRSLGYEMSF
jgi:hypothetical protein